MAYTSGFKWDLFIGYPEERKKWAQDFHDDLHDELSAAKGLKVYFAPKSWELGEDSDGMLEAARSSAVFVAIVTKDALGGNAARFMRKEMETFRQSSRLKRTFCPIPLEPIDSVQLSRAMPTASPEAFWNANLLFYRIEDGAPIRDQRNSERYNTAIQKVAYQLRKRLDELKDGDDPGKGPFADMIVCLAPNAPGSSTEQEWQDVRSLLLNDGVVVLPSVAEISDGDPDAVDLQGAVKTADLFLQIFSAEEAEHAKAQLRTVEDCRSNVPALQWRKKSKDKIIDTAILDALEKKNKELREFCEGAQTVTLEHFKVEIRRELAEIKAAKEDPPPPPPEQPYIYITADTTDRPLARQLQTTARERSSVAVIMNEDEGQRRDDFERNLVLASGVVFLHGTATTRFVEGWLNEFAMKTRLLRLHPKIVALYEAPPEKPEDELPALPMKLRIEGSQKEFTLAGIEKICAELRGDRP